MGGIISGTVTNAVNGLIIPGTLVVLDSDSTFSDENGQYEFYLSLENVVMKFIQLLIHFVPMMVLLLSQMITQVAHLYITFQ